MDIDTYGLFSGASSYSGVEGSWFTIKYRLNQACRMAAVGTWSFSHPAVERMRCMILAGQNSTDVVETALAGSKCTKAGCVGVVTNSADCKSKGEIGCDWTHCNPDHYVEDDVQTGRHIVGRGGFPNNRGIVECDAAIMEGVPGRFGAVAALQGVGQPSRVARRVLEKSPHSFLVGEGAEAFAREQGFVTEPNDNMLSDHTATAYQDFLKTGKHVSGHDTIGLIALDLQGHITVGVSTSGKPFKAPGRVGDSPLPGCGLYADHTVGAAAASGDGDKIMCYCPSFQIIQLMRQGLSPEEACCSVLTDIKRKAGEEKCFEIALIALNMKGETGAASSVKFPFTFWKQGMDSVERHIQSD